MTAQRQATTGTGPPLAATTGWKHNAAASHNAVGSSSRSTQPPRCPVGSKRHMTQQLFRRHSRTLHHRCSTCFGAPTCPILLIQRPGGRHVAEAHGVEEELLEPPLQSAGGRLQARWYAWSSSLTAPLPAPLAHSHTGLLPPRSARQCPPRPLAPTCTNLTLSAQGTSGMKLSAVSVCWREKGITHLKQGGGEQAKHRFSTARSDDTAGALPPALPLPPLPCNSAAVAPLMLLQWMPGTVRTPSLQQHPHSPLAGAGHQGDVLCVVAACGLHGLQRKGAGAHDHHILHFHFEHRGDRRPAG